MILDNASSHVVRFARVGKSRGFSTLELNNMILIFLPPNVMSVIKPLNQGIIASFKIQYKKKLLQWVMSLDWLRFSTNESVKTAKVTGPQSHV